MGYESLHNGQGGGIELEGEYKDSCDAEEILLYIKILKFINCGDFVYFITLTL